MTKKIVIIERDELLKDLLTDHISNFFKKDSGIDFYNVVKIEDILNQTSIDLLIVNYLEVFEKIQTL